MTMRSIADLVILVTCLVVLTLIAIERASSNLQINPYTQENFDRSAGPR
ncbi:MAG TPA: hypothetical protein VIF11_01275 [Methylomirabilota bacterium]|jgi:hypothetical protein